MPPSEKVAWACVVWLIVGFVVGAWLRGRQKPRRRRATPDEVAALSYECSKTRDLERENARLRDQVMTLSMRVVELENQLKDSNVQHLVWRVVRTPRDDSAAASEGMGV